MTIVEWNLFAEGICDEKDLLTLELPGVENLIIYVKGQCEICKQTTWIKQMKNGANVCNQCIP